MTAKLFAVISIGVVAVILPALPFPAIPASITSSILTVVGYINSLNGVFPIDTILLLFTVTMTFEFALFTYKLVLWLYNFLQRGDG